MYDLFLDLINKKKTSTVPPDEFNRRINDAQELWMAEKAPEGETIQKRIDDLEAIRVVTDGTQTYNGVQLDPLSPVSTGSYEFEFLPATYPSYFRLMNASFKITYQDNECFTDGTISDFLHSDIMRSDRRTQILKDPFNWPKDSRLYYEIISGRLRLITETSSTAYQARLEYYRYPEDMVYDDDQNNWVNCEFGSKQMREITAKAATIYIEEVENTVRYQTINIENLKKKQTD